MPMFSMFVASPPAGIRVNDIYREKFAFGPFGELAGDIPAELSGFWEALWLEVSQSATEFHTLRLICDGTIRVVGVQRGFPSDASDSPL